MKLWHFLGVLSLIAVAALTLGCSPGANPPTTQVATTRTAATQPKVERDEFTEMEEICKLSGDQLAAFRAKVQQRHADWAAYNASDKAQKINKLNADLAAAKQAKDDKKVADLQAQLEPLVKEQNQYRAKIRAEAMGVLTLDQQKVWTSYILCDKHVMRRFGKAKLTDDQKTQVAKLCDEAADKFVKADTIANDPYLKGLPEVANGVNDAVIAKVLTGEQKQAIAPKPAATKPSAPATKPA